MLPVRMDRVVVVMAGSGFIAVMPGAMVTGMRMPAVAGVSGTG
jgi:hypothetical protein